jgi:rare lipoprotein A
MKKSFIVILLTSISLSAFAQNFSQEGLASYYADNLAGSYTAYGESYDPDQKTAAHASLPINSLVKVTNLVNNRSVIVKINDKLSESNRKVIMLSRAAAVEIDLVIAGSLKVRVEEFRPEEPKILARATTEPSKDVWSQPVTESAMASSKPEAVYRSGSFAPAAAKPVVEKFASSGTYNCDGLPVANVRGYTVQVAALSSLKAFTQLCADLGKKDIGAEIYVQVAENEKGKLYRILIGNFASFDVAKEKLAQVVSHGYQAVVRTHSPEASVTKAR